MKSSKPLSSSRRQDPISCSLCRLKKLRCNRQHPCSNCLARNVPCDREGSLPAQPAATVAAPFNDAAIMARLDRLESLLIQINATGQQASHERNAFVVRQRTPESGLSPLVNENATEAAHQVDTKRLEDIGTRETFTLTGLSDDLHFEIVPLDQIYAAYTQPRHQTSTVFNNPRIIVLPHLSEALTFLDIYTEHVDYLHHILHLSKLRTQIHTLYSYLSDSDGHQKRVPSTTNTAAIAPAALILSVFANAATCLAEIQSKISLQGRCTTPAWLSLMATPQARACTIQWFKAALACLEHARHVGSECIEDVQAMVMIYFLMYNLEGFSARARIGLGQAIAVARDLGLHRLDCPLDRQQQRQRDPAETEIARRVWWYVCACDWLLALSGGPQEGIYNVQPTHMAVNLPRNIHDADLLNPSTALDFELPLSAPTAMSYLIQRVKLASICRKIVDAMPMSPSTPDMIPYEEFVLLDREFERLLEELPPFFQAQNSNESVIGMLHEDWSSALSKEATHITTQRYMIRMTTHTRRCKFHQPYLIRGFTDPKYHHSRDVCLQSARVVVDVLKNLDKEGLIAMGMLRLSGMHHHLFFATIALVMDLCFNKEDGVGGRARERERKEEVAQACRILEEAKGKSVVAQRFLAGLMDVLRRHGVSLVDDPESAGETGIDHGDRGGRQVGTAEVGDASLQMHVQPDGSDFEQIWQMYIENAASLDVENWEELFDDVETF